MGEWVIPKVKAAPLSRHFPLFFLPREFLESTCLPPSVSCCFFSSFFPSVICLARLFFSLYACLFSVVFSHAFLSLFLSFRIGDFLLSWIGISEEDFFLQNSAYFLCLFSLLFCSFCFIPIFHKFFFLYSSTKYSTFSDIILFSFKYLNNFTFLFSRSIYSSFLIPLSLFLYNRRLFLYNLCNHSNFQFFSLSISSQFPLSYLALLI